MSLTGDQVVSKHTRAIKACSGQTGMPALKCIVDSMRSEYGKV